MFKLSVMVCARLTPDACVSVVSIGTFVDCLGGQWWAHSLNLGYILPEDHVKSTVSSVFTGNHVDSFKPGMCVHVECSNACTLH